MSPEKIEGIPYAAIKIISDLIKKPLLKYGSGTISRYANSIEKGVCISGGSSKSTREFLQNYVNCAHLDTHIPSSMSLYANIMKNRCDFLLKPVVARAVLTWVLCDV